MTPTTEGTEEARAAEVRRVVVLILWLNLLVAAAKAAYGWWSGSLAVGTDAIHSLLDASSNVVGIIALRLAVAPPDREHPYGHAKIEIIAAAAIGILIAGGALRFGYAAIDALWNRRPSPLASATGFIVVGATWVVNMLVAAYEHRRGRQLKSHFLVADAAHTASDVAVTAAVLLSMAATRMGVAWADPVGALLVLLVIVRVAWHILAANIMVLLDAAVVDAAEVERIALAVEGVLGCHRVRSRGTEGAVQLDLHILVDGDQPLRVAHEIAHQVEEALRAGIENIADVTIHMEPEEDGVEQL